MQRLAHVVVGFALILGSAGLAGAKCGDRAGDAGAMTATEASLAARCSCCGPRAAYAACVASVLRKAVGAKTLPGRCAATVRTAARSACPLRPTAIPCRTCNADADCAAGEFCECRAGTCSKTGGVCVNRPQVCPDVVAPVCGCNGTTYPNDCERQGAGVCRAHAGPCTAAAGCFDTIELRCTGAACSAAGACPLPNEFCSPRCATATTTTTLPGGGCQTDADCNDGNPCTVDRCASGHCEHGCICVAPGGGSCCGPGPLCVNPCGKDANGVCGGACPDPSQSCTASGATCACGPTSKACGDTFPACDGGCPAGRSCKSLTGAPACQCVPASCQPGDGTFFYTCGDPVCGGHRPQPGVPPCTTQQPGEACSCLGEECDPGDACDRLLECATSDPTHGGVCPISRRAYKENIQYLTPADVKRLHDELLGFRLASYRYKAPEDSKATHLGFMIDDVEPSPAVAPNGQTVDLYAYTSMAVAAVQEQAREIDRLKREVELLRQELRVVPARTTQGDGQPTHP